MARSAGIVALLVAAALIGLPAGGAASSPAPAPATAPGDVPARKLVVICTLPTLASLAQEVGGDRVDAVSLAKGDQDPHFVSPTPVLMQRTREAELFVEVGMSLELWADQVIAGSGNPSIAAGTTGMVTASTGVPPLEVPSVLSRSQGDIHPQGNPHLWLDPVRAKRMAANIEKGLEGKAPGDAEYFRGRLKSFEDRIDRALYGDDLIRALGVKYLDRLVLEGRLRGFLDANEIGGKKLSSLAGGWLKAAAPLAGKRAVEYHRVWIYFARTFGMDLRGTIEERPGIPPGPQHLRAIEEKMRDEKIGLILVDNFYDPAVPRKVGEVTGARVLILPNQVRGEEGVASYFELMDYIIGRLAKAAGE